MLSFQFRDAGGNYSGNVEVRKGFVGQFCLGIRGNSGGETVR